jgi:hypothetical protein
MDGPVPLQELDIALQTLTQVAAAISANDFFSSAPWRFLHLKFPPNIPMSKRDRMLVYHLPGHY